MFAPWQALLEDSSGKNSRLKQSAWFLRPWAEKNSEDNIRN